MSAEGPDTSRAEPGESDAPLRLLPHSATPDSGGAFVSVGTKLGVAVVLVVTIATALAFVWFSARERDALIEAKRQAADMVGDLFAASLAAPLDFGDEDGVNAELKNLGQNRDVTHAAVFQGERAAPLSALVRDGQRSPTYAALSEGTRVHEDRVEVVRRVHGAEAKLVGKTFVRFSLARENAAFAANRRHMFLLCFLVALGTTGVLLFVSRRQVGRPIAALLAAVKRLERGERRITVGVRQRDEIGRLARAFEAMEAAISDREARLSRANHSLRELFDHIGQAILVFDLDGRVVGAQSRQATEVFRARELKGQVVRDLLYPGRGPWDAELRAFDAWLGLAFEATPEDWAEIARLAPSQVRLPDEVHERVLSLGFRPIVIAGRTERVMLLASDETVVDRLEREVKDQGERHARQLKAMQKLVSGGGQRFVSFLESGRTRVARVLGLFRSGTQLEESDFTECFGHIHTLRGEARVFGLDDLAERADLLESRFARLRAGATEAGASAIAIPDRGTEDELEAMSRELDDAESRFVAASPTGRAVLEQMSVRRPDLLRMCEAATRQGGELALLAERLSSRSLGELTTALCENAPRWAESLNKLAEIEIDGREALVPERIAKELSGALTHLVKNAIAHGIEVPGERERVGKPAVGLVRIGAASGENGTLTALYVDDDGRGIDDNPRLSALATARTSLSDDTGRRVSFRSLPVTDDAELAGRGVGLTAVVSDLSAVGFSLSVERRTPSGARFAVTAREVGR